MRKPRKSSSLPDMTTTTPHRNLRPRSREARYRYDGQIRLMVPFDPWRLLLTLHGVNLSISGVSALLARAAATPPPPVIGLKDRRPSWGGEGDGSFGAEALLVEGDPYDLQLEHEADHLSAPFLRARLVRRQRTAAGLELAFAFEEPDGDLLGLVHDLGLRGGGR